MQHFGIPFAGGMFHVMESQNCARIRDFVKNAFTLLDAKISVVSHDATAPAARRQRAMNGARYPHEIIFDTFMENPLLYTLVLILCIANLIMWSMVHQLNHTNEVLDQISIKINERGVP